MEITRLRFVSSVKPSQRHNQNKNVNLKSTATLYWYIYMYSFCGNKCNSSSSSFKFIIDTVLHGLLQNVHYLDNVTN